MNKDEILKRIMQWGKNGEFDKIIDAILALPEDSVDDDMMERLATAYSCVGEYKKAIAVIEGLRAKKENTWFWQYNMGYALVHAADDEECEGDDALRENILQQARTCFSRCMVLNPPEKCLEDCDKFLQMIEDELFGEDEFSEEDNGGDFYDDDDADALEEHIKKHFGDFPSVYRELAAPDIYIDVCVVPPSEERNYYTLITFGMGCRQMNVPEIYSDQPSRIELFLRLPADWKVGENDEEWCWPLILLKNIGRLPVACDTWVGHGHTIDNHETFSVNTRLSASIVLNPESLSENARVCALPSGESVEFFEVVPLYREEMFFKIDNSVEELIERLKSADCGRIVDISRPSAVSMDYVLNSELFMDSIYDTTQFHYESIVEKGLPLDPIAAANHIAFFLRWCIESDFCSEEITERFPELVQEVKNGTLTDLRWFIINRFDGAFFRTLIAQEYRGFTDWYYKFGDVGFPHDVDACAEEYFGTERFNSAEFQDEAYLFVPFDEECYQRIAAKITQKYCEYVLEKSDCESAKVMQHTMQDAFGRLCSIYDICFDCKEYEPEYVAFQNFPLIHRSSFAAISAYPIYPAGKPYSGAIVVGDFAAKSLEQAAANMTAGFERDNYEIPQKITDKSKQFGEKTIEKPIIIPCNFALQQRLFIPSDDGYYSVSRPVCAFLRCEELKRLLLTRKITGERLYNPKHSLHNFLGCQCVELGRLPIQTALQIYECAQKNAKAIGVNPVLAIIADKRSSSAAAQLDAAISQPQEFALVDFPADWEESDYLRRRAREMLPPVQSQNAKRFETEYGVKPLVILHNENTSDGIIMLPKGDKYSVIRKLNDNTYGTLSDLTDALSDLLECEVCELETIRSESEFHRAYEKALSDGKRNNYIPLLIKALPDFVINAANADCYKTLPFGKKAHFKTRHINFCKQAEERLNENDAQGDIEQGVPLTKFITFKSEQGGRAPILCAKLPTDGSALARLFILGVFGKNYTEESPKEIVKQLTAAEKEWRKFGAVPAVLGSNTLEFYVSSPAKKGDEKLLAAQMLTLCKGLAAVSGFKELAGSLPNSKVWFFCW